MRRRAAIIAHLDWEGNINLFVALSRLAPCAQHACVMHEPGLCLIREKDWEGALDSFTEAIELDPLQSRLYVHRAVVWTSLGAVEKALRDTEAAVETGCRSGDLFVLRSKLFAQIGSRRFYACARVPRTHPMRFPCCDCRPSG